MCISVRVTCLFKHFALDLDVIEETEIDKFFYFLGKR